MRYLLLILVIFPVSAALCGCGESETEVADIETLTRELLAVQDATELEALVGRWGVRRTSPRFWQTFDWVHAVAARENATEAGLFDLGRYVDP